MSPKTFIDPPIHLCSPSPAVKFMICAMLAELLTDGDNAESDRTEVSDTAGLPWKTATALFGAFDRNRINSRMLAATFEDDPVCSPCDVMMRYNVFSYATTGGFCNVPPDGVFPVYFTFSQTLLQRLQREMPENQWYPHPCAASVVRYVMREVFDSDLVLAAVALEHAHYELRGDYDSTDVETIKARIHKEAERLRADPANQVEPARLIGETDAAAAVK